MARERQYERLMEMDTCGVERWDYRDLTVTDVVVWEFDTEGDSSPAVGLGFSLGDARPRSRLYLDTTGYPCAVGLVGGSLKLAEGWGDSSPAVGLVEGDARQCVSTISADKRIKRIVHIKRQNDIEIVSADSSVVLVRDSVRVRENEQNKSSPDKGSWAVFSVIAVVVVIIIILAIMVLIKFIKKAVRGA